MPSVWEVADAIRDGQERPFSELELYVPLRAAWGVKHPSGAVMVGTVLVVTVLSVGIIGFVRIGPAAGTPSYFHIVVSAQPDALTITSSTFHYVISLTNPNEVKVSYVPQLQVTMTPTWANSLAYSRVIVFNMTFPLTLDPHQTRVIYSDEIHLNNASNGTYWLQVLGKSTSSVVVLTEPTLVTLNLMTPG